MALEIDKNLKAIRILRGLKQREMAKLIRISLRYYQEVEQGRRDLSTSKFEEILYRLSITPIEFFSANGIVQSFEEKNRVRK